MVKTLAFLWLLRDLIEHSGEYSAEHSEEYSSRANKWPLWLHVEERI